MFTTHAILCISIVHTIAFTWSRLINGFTITHVDQIIRSMCLLVQTTTPIAALNEVNTWTA